MNYKPVTGIIHCYEQLLLPLGILHIPQPVRTPATAIMCSQMIGRQFCLFLNTIRQSKLEGNYHEIRNRNGDADYDVSSSAD